MMTIWNRGFIVLLANLVKKEGDYMFKRVCILLGFILVSLQIINSIIDIVKKIEQPRCSTVVLLNFNF